MPAITSGNHPDKPSAIGFVEGFLLDDVSQQAISHLYVCPKVSKSIAYV